MYESDSEEKEDIKTPIFNEKIYKAEIRENQNKTFFFTQILEEDKKNNKAFIPEILKIDIEKILKNLKNKIEVKNQIDSNDKK